MKSLLKRDFINYINVAITAAILIPIGFILSMPPYVISLFLVLLSLVIGVFFSEHHSSVNRFMVSLPIDKSKLASSRYLSIFIFWIGTITYQFLLGYFFDYFVPYSVFVFGWKELITLLNLGLITLAIYVPLYYLFNSFVLPTIIIFICYFVVFLFAIDALVTISGMKTEIIFNNLDQWVVPLVESSISFQPFFLLTLLGFGLYFLSMKFSMKIIKRKSMI